MITPTRHLHIGELIATKEPLVVSTVLGSCVSVCLFSENGAGAGIIHYFLPSLSNNDQYTNGLRFGDFAIEQLVDVVCEMTGLSAHHLKAKIVGGAEGINTNEKNFKVGQENIAIARKILNRFHIPIVGEDVGGSFGRKILFHLHTGRLQSSVLDGKSIARKEKKSAKYEQPKNEVKGLSTLEKRNLIAFKGVDKKAFTRQEKTIPKKRVLIVDDSKTIRSILSEIIKQDPQLEVAGQAADPIEAEKLIMQLKPDVITLDVHMPKMTGLEWLKSLIPKYRLPVVIVTSLELKSGNEVFEALELGAVDYIQKPSLSEMSTFSPVIREKIISASQAKIRIHQYKKAMNARNATGKIWDAQSIVAIGASTGGTEALREVLTGLPVSIPPIIVVQHIPPIFSRAFADRLNDLCPFEVKEAESGDVIRPNRVLIAPGGRQMKVVRKAKGFCVEVNDDSMVNRHKPSVDYLFNSVAGEIGSKAIGIILTGMGADGAQGLLKMKQHGAITLSQDEASSVVYGMPKEAWDIGASQLQVSLDDVPQKIMDILGIKKVS